MNDFLKMDIFFAVATVFTIGIGTFAALALYQLWRIFKNINHISSQVAAESDNIRADIAQLRTDIREGKGKMLSTLSFLSNLSNTAKSSRKTKKGD